MKRRPTSPWLRFSAALAVAVVMATASGCSHQSDSHGGWTQNEVTAFRGAPPTAQDRKDMAAEISKARQNAHFPAGFSSVAPSPNAAGGK